MSVVQPPSKNDDLATACNEDLRMAYQEVCRSFHAIDDFRAKLLGFLPLASGAGIFLLLNGRFTDGTGQYLLPIGVFGFAVTLGLFFYELREIQECNSLVWVGKKIEELLGINGQFRSIPPRLWRGLISHTSAAYVIYSAVLAAWTFVALVNVISLWASVIALVVLVSLFIIFVIFHVLDLEGEAKEEPNKG